MADAKQMSKTERQTLIRLVRQRFKLLETGLAARRRQLEAVTRKQVIEEHEAEVEKWKARFDAEVMGPMRELVKAGETLIEEGRRAGYDRRGYGWHNLYSTINSTDNNAHFVPLDLEDTVKERVAEAMGDKPLTKYALELEESRLVETLLVGDLSSDDAKAFLEQIPDLEKLVPLPSNGSKAALMEASDEYEYQQQRRRR